MQELIVISGKGGTGKTSLMAAFASLAGNKVLCDADVDAADLHLVLAPDIRRREPFVSGHTAVIDKDRCTECGLCRELCRWEAIGDNFAVDAIDCEGCGVCVHFCPEKAIDFPDNTCGEWFVSETRFGPLVHARLGIAEENSGKLVALVRQEARKVAEDRGARLLLTDGPPGVGCPVIASLGGASGVLIVAEPSVSGVHDMQRVADLAAHFKVPAMVCVNKFDINPAKSREIEAYAARQELTFLGRIPFDPTFTRAMVRGQTLFEFAGHSDARPAVADVWRGLLGHLATIA
jgi:MinD superfamily P-loop ATPase